MDIQAEKNIIIERLKLLNDMNLIQRIKKLLDYSHSNPEERITIEQYNKELEEADAEIDAGKGISLEDFKKEMEKW